MISDDIDIRLFDLKTKEKNVRIVKRKSECSESLRVLFGCISRTKSTMNDV